MSFTRAASPRRQSRGAGPPRIRNLNFHADQIPPNVTWPVDVPEVVAQFADVAVALSVVVRERFGAVFVYPAPEVDRTFVRLEWDLGTDRRDRRRLGLLLRREPGSAPTCAGYVAWGGDQKPLRSDAMTLTAAERRAIDRDFSDVIARARTRLRGPSGRSRPLFYMDLQGPWKIVSETKLNVFGATLFPTMVVRPNVARVSAVGFEVADGSIVASQETARLAFVELIALIALVSGTPASFARNVPHDFVVPSVVPRDRSQLYPRKMFGAERSGVAQDLGPLLVSFAEALGRLSPDDREIARRVMLANGAGVETARSQPTIAAVAFLAALSALADDIERCGKGYCTVHGRAVEHTLRGEPRAIAEKLIALGVVEPAAEPLLLDLLSRLYRQQRSAFVHDAQFSHQEERGMTTLLSLPTETAAVSEAWGRRRDLDLLAQLSHSAALAFLVSQSGGRIAPDVLKVNLTARTGFDASIRARPGTRLGVHMTGRKPMYVVAQPRAEIHVGLHDIVVPEPSSKSPSPALRSARPKRRG